MAARSRGRWRTQVCFAALICCAATASPSYEVLEMGRSCSMPLRIETREECRSAARVLGLDVSDAKLCGHTLMNYAPGGCYIVQLGCCKGLWFNTKLNSTSTGKRVHGTHICKRSANATETTGSAQTMQEVFEVFAQNADLVEDAAGSGADEVLIRNVSKGMIAAKKITASEGQGPVTIAIPGTVAKIEIPISAIPSQLKGDTIVLRIGLMNDETNAQIEAATNQSRRIRVDGTISVDMVASSDPGNSIAVENLAEPILIRIPVNTTASRDALCVFLDTATSEWSTNGVSRVQVEDEFVCAVHHLTLFGAIRGLLAKALACANAEVLSKAGLAQVVHGGWWRYEAALWVWCVVFFHSLLIAVGFERDRRAKKEFEWRDEWFITSNTSAKFEKVSLKVRIQTKIRHGKEMLSQTKEDFRTLLARTDQELRAGFYTWLRNLFFKGLVKLGVSLSSMMFVSSVGMAPNHASTLCKSGMSSAGATGETPTQRERAFGRVASKTQAWIGSNQDVFVSSSCAARYRLFLFIVHPWLAITKRSIYMPSSTRALMLMANVMGALMTSALFFSTASPSMANDSPSECQPSNIWDQLGMMIVVGCASLVLSQLPLLFFASLHSRVFIIEEEERKQRRLIRIWWLKDRLLWLFCVAYIASCTLYAVAFAANVGEQDRLKWVLSSVVSIVKKSMLLPFLISFLLTLLSGAVGRHPAVVRECRLQVEHMYTIGKEGDKTLDSIGEGVDVDHVRREGKTEDQAPLGWVGEPEEEYPPDPKPEALTGYFVDTMPSAPPPQRIGAPRRQTNQRFPFLDCCGGLGTGESCCSCSSCPHDQVMPHTQRQNVLLDLAYEVTDVPDLPRITTSARIVRQI